MIIRELHKKNYPILWDGHLVPPGIMSRLFMPAPQANLGYFFIWKCLNESVGLLKPSIVQIFYLVTGG